MQGIFLYTSFILYICFLFYKYIFFFSSYGLGEERLQAFLISFHYLLHVADSIEDLGPCRGFWQFLMERLCGMLIPLVSSRKLPYVNLFNNA